MAVTTVVGVEIHMYGYSYKKQCDEQKAVNDCSYQHPVSVTRLPCFCCHGYCIWNDKIRGKLDLV